MRFEFNFLLTLFLSMHDEHATWSTRLIMCEFMGVGVETTFSSFVIYVLLSIYKTQIFEQTRNTKIITLPKNVLGSCYICKRNINIASCSISIPTVMHFSDRNDC